MRLSRYCLQHRKSLGRDLDATLPKPVA